MQSRTRQPSLTPIRIGTSTISSKHTSSPHSHRHTTAYSSSPTSHLLNNHLHLRTAACSSTSTRSTTLHRHLTTHSLNNSRLPHSHRPHSLSSDTCSKRHSRLPRHITITTKRRGQHHSTCLLHPHCSYMTSQITMTIRVWLLRLILRTRPRSAILLVTPSRHTRPITSPL